MRWLAEHWGLVALGLVVVSNILNAITRHFSSQESRAARVLLTISEGLSILSSADVPGRLKLPLTSKPPPE